MIFLQILSSVPFKHAYRNLNTFEFNDDHAVLFDNALL